MEWSWNYTESLNKRRVVIGKNKHQIIPSGWRAMRFWFSSGQAIFSSFSGMFYLKIPSYLLPLSAFGSFPSWTSQIIIYFRCSITKESDCFEEEVHNRQKHQYSSSMRRSKQDRPKASFSNKSEFRTMKVHEPCIWDMILDIPKIIFPCSDTVLSCLHSHIEGFMMWPF